MRCPSCERAIVPARVAPGDPWQEGGDPVFVVGGRCPHLGCGRWVYAVSGSRAAEPEAIVCEDGLASWQRARVRTYARAFGPGLASAAVLAVGATVANELPGASLGDARWVAPGLVWIGFLVQLAWAGARVSRLSARAARVRARPRGLRLLGTPWSYRG